jgi:hypothetical protein
VASDTLLVAFGTPFYRTDPKTKKKIPSGVVFANYSLDGLKDLMTSLNLGKTGYGYLLSKKGTFIYSPREDLVKEQKNIFQIAKQYKSEKLRVAAEKALNGSKIEIDLNNPYFTALEIVSACGAFLFIIIIDQINLRQKIITAGIIYFDYFYFVLYITILLVAINAILFASNIKLNWIHYKDHLIPKLFYWPTNLTLLLLVTLLVFY